MKLPERFESDRAEEALDPEVEARLAAIDAALAGGPVPRGSEDLAQLARELRAERAEPNPDFAAQLDRWAADGFPRAERPGAAPGPAERTAASLQRLGARARSIQLRRLIAPVGAAAVTILVIGVAVSQNTGGMDQGDAGDGASVSGAAQDRATAGESAQGAAPDAGQEAGDAAQLAIPEGGDRESLSEASNLANGKALRNRRVARDADLVLAAEPQEITEVADGVNEVVNRYRGFVTSSSVQSGDRSRGGLGAEFRMKIPARDLQPALADLSELAHVRSRTEGTEDITGRFISAQERIEENEAAREGLLDRLANATTDTEAAAIRAQLRIVNAQLSAARADLAGAQRRVQLVPITVSVVAEEGASDRDRPADDGWSVGDAIDDAGEVLSTTAGILIIVGAVLLPLALVALLVALALRAWASRGRERALDEA